MTSEAEQLPEVFLGRQPILDSRQATLGYELLFRKGPQNRADIESPKKATSDVVCKAFAELGLSSALANQLAFINVDPEFLLEDLIELLPPRQTVLEIESAQDFGPILLQRCSDLAARGYAFSLHWSGESGAGFAALPDLLSYVKIDVGADMPATFKALSGRLQHRHARMIASRVETADEMQQCARLGFDLFQGYFFARPVVIEGRELDPSTRGLFRIIDLAGREEADQAEIEAAFKGEPALLINLLRLTNSVAVGGGLSSRITSVRNAITVLGQRQLLRWLQLLLFHRPDTPLNRNPLLQLAALRGRLMELMAEKAYRTRRDLMDLAFITGLMSFMPTALSLPMTDILSHISVAPDARRALSRHEGELGFLLELIERYDDNDMAGTVGLLQRLGDRLTLNDLGGLLTQAIAWVHQLTADGE